MARTFVGVGVMSGTSLDGIDLCAVQLTENQHKNTYHHAILSTKTVSYSKSWRESLIGAHNLNGESLIELNIRYSHLQGETIKQFLNEVNTDVDFVSTHGHTIFHQPEKGFTFQLGDGETIVSHLPCSLVCGMRNKDVALGGQGAPLVPFGEPFLFGQYHMCLNLGGISNISIQRSGFDVCPCNMLLNYLANKYDNKLEFDEDGSIAANGTVLPDVLDKMNSLNFYKLDPPKSLGREWFEQFMEQTFNTEDHAIKDLMRTAVAHIVQQIVASICKFNDATSTQQTCLITGGGALNKFLIQCLKARLATRAPYVQVVIEETEVTEYKEALVFAFLGLRCLLAQCNVNKKVTGSQMDSVSGSIHIPPAATGQHPLLRFINI